MGKLGSYHGECRPLAERLSDLIQYRLKLQESVAKCRRTCAKKKYPDRAECYLPCQSTRVVQDQNDRDINETRRALGKCMDRKKRREAKARR